MRKSLSPSVRSEACRVDFSRPCNNYCHSECSENLNIIKIYCGFYPQYVKNNYLVYFKAIFQKLKRFCVCNIKHTA